MILYGTPKKKLISKISTARNVAQDIARRLSNVTKSVNGSAKDAMLLQFFVLEQFGVFKKYCLTKEFFLYHDMNPDTVDPIVWIASWIFTLGTTLFFIYWIFAWGVQNNGSTFSAWGLNYGIGAIQDIFFVQIVKIYFIRYLGKLPLYDSISWVLIVISCRY